MGRYEAWLKRKSNATPYANEAVCKKCKHAEYVKTKAFCFGRGTARALSEKEWENTNPCFCPEYKPRNVNLKITFKSPS